VRNFIRGENLFRGLRLALVATLATSLYLAYGYLVTRRGFVESSLGASDVAQRFSLDVLGAFIALFISATAGFAWASRPPLAGFGSLRTVRRDLWLILPAGAALALVILFVLEPLLYKPLVPAQRNPFEPVFVALFEEVICRWGILAIAYRLSRRVWPSILTAAAFNVVIALNPTLKLLAASGEPLEAWRLVGLVLVKFALAVGLGLLCVRKGLFSTMALRFVAALPAPILALLT